MIFFIENLWFWFGTAFIAACAGYFFYQNKPSLKMSAISVTVPVLLLAVGLTLYYAIDTDRKTIRRMLNGLTMAIASNDVEKVLNDYVSPNADKTRALARANMALVKIFSAKYRDLKFQVNELTAPPTATVQFTAVIYWTSQGSIEGFSIDKPVPEIIKFDIEIEKTNDSHSTWKITNKCRFTPQATP